jgi:3-oxocholest-4-en-26-oate---CoA ligase
MVRAERTNYERSFGSARAAHLDHHHQLMADFTFPHVHEAIAAAQPDAPCIIWRGRTWTWRETTERSRRFANALLTTGSKVPVERDYLDGHESGQDHLAIYAENGNEWLETFLGAFKARVAPFNVNYRYVAEELLYLLRNAEARFLVIAEKFTPVFAEVRDQLPNITAIFQIMDGSGHGLLPGAVEYEAALAAASPERPESQVMGGDWSTDDLYILYTGGTTGMPKGVLWRQADIAASAMGLRDAVKGVEWSTLDEVVAFATSGASLVTLPSAPFMHGAGQWIAFTSWHRGGPVVIQDDVTRLDPADIWRNVAAHRVQFLQIVGDAFGRPLVEELEARAGAGEPYDMSSMFILLSGGAALSEGLKKRFLAAIPHMMIIDGIGSSEAGGQMQNVSAGGNASTGTFMATSGNHVLAEDLSCELDAGHEGMGWLAKSGRLPLGYLGDADKTAKTFPTVNGVRYSVPGDRARLLPGTEASMGVAIVELHGRDSVTINSGGEKIFAEEVEAALLTHSAVYDVVVTGRPSERWGSEVVAIVQLADGSGDVDDASLLDAAAQKIARYKLPKAIVRVEQLVRSPSGKADYRWAKDIAAGAAG